MIKATFQEASMTRMCPRNVQERRKPQEKYLRESYYHRIKYITATFLAHLCREDPWTVLPWQPQLTEGKKGVFDGTSTQVATQMIDKCRVKRVQEGLYNKKDPQWGGDRKNSRKNTVAIFVFVLNFNWLIWTLTSLDCKFIHICVCCFIQIIF